MSFNPGTIITWAENFFGRFPLSRQAPRAAFAPQPFIRGPDP
jgi:hypothetical protein